MKLVQLEKTDTNEEHIKLKEICDVILPKDYLLGGGTLHRDDKKKFFSKIVGIKILKNTVKTSYIKASVQEIIFTDFFIRNLNKYLVDKLYDLVDKNIAVRDYSKNSRLGEILNNLNDPIGYIYNQIKD